MIADAGCCPSDDDDILNNIMLTCRQTALHLPTIRWPALYELGASGMPSAVASMVGLSVGYVNVIFDTVRKLVSNSFLIYYSST